MKDRMDLEDRRSIGSSLEPSAYPPNDPDDPAIPTGSRLTSASLIDATVVTHDGTTRQTMHLASGRVSAVSASDSLAIDLTDHLIYPGLINAHDHLHLNAIPPLPHDAPFANSYEWIDAFAPWHADPSVIAAVAVPKEIRLRHGALRNLLAGVTTVAHHDPWHPALDDPDFPVDALRGAGWCHSLGLAGRYGPLPRLSHGATPPDRPWIIHLAEGTDRVARSELARLDALGCLTSNTVIVHGVGLTADDVERVIACGASVVWCPASNVALLGRTLDPTRLAAAGRLALGSDSRLSGARDLLDELRVAAEASMLSAAELLRLVTHDAARVLRFGDRGTLGIGERADCVIVRAGDNPHRTLLDTRRDAIRAVVRGGVPLVADPDFADWFAHCGVATVRACVDGRPKLIARHLVSPAVAALEPGLEVAWSAP